jgi:uncharacterized membrane protein YkoI
MLKSWMWVLTIGAGLCIDGTILSFADEAIESKIALEDAPPAIQKTLKREAAGAPIGKIDVETEDGKTTYEVNVTLDGKVYEIQIAEDGTLIGKNLQTDDESEVKVKFSDAPAAVQKTLKREAGGAPIETVTKKAEDDKTTYDAEATIEGKLYEITVAADGILQHKTLKEDDEIEMELSDCPKPVQKTLNREANGGEIDKVEKETRYGKPVYEIDVKIDGHNYEILVAEDGVLLSKALDEDGED